MLKKHNKKENNEEENPSSRYAKPIQNPSPHPPSPNLKIEDIPYKKIKQKLSRSMKIRGGMRKKPTIEERKHGHYRGLHEPELPQEKQDQGSQSHFH